MQKIDDFLGAQPLPHVVATAINASDTLYEGAFGGIAVGAENNAAVTMDTPFAIMSMTKPITSVAILILADEGALHLDDVAARYVPQYAEVPVISQVDFSAGTFKAEPSDQLITVRQLLTHTAGIGYPFCNTTLARLMPASNALDFGLVHPPGEAWTYGASTRILGEVIEAVTGQTLEEALTELVFEPLGMRQTGFDPKPNQAHVHIEANDLWIPQDLTPRMAFGDGGLISTARDYAKFLQCLLNNGKGLLKAKTFREAISNQIGDLFITEQPAAVPSLTHPFPAGAGRDKWGLGFQIHMTAEEGMRSPGSFSWCGLYNTYFWGDPVKKIGGIVLMQVLPLYEPVCRDTVNGFEQRLYVLT